jgi:hypothetical protein
VTFASGACTDLSGPTDTYQLPPPDTSLAPDRLVVGSYIATPCELGIRGNQFAHLRGRDEWALVDVFFGRSTEAGPWGAPTAHDIALVTAHGGRVLYRFHIPAVRARMVLSRIPDLVGAGEWITVREVPDPTRYDLELSVGFTRPLTDADVEDFVRLGGRVTYAWDFINALAGILPDRSIPAYQERADVAWVQANGVSCLL